MVSIFALKTLSKKGLKTISKKGLKPLSKKGVKTLSKKGLKTISKKARQPRKARRPRKPRQPRKHIKKRLVSTPARGFKGIYRNQNYGVQTGEPVYRKPATQVNLILLPSKWPKFWDNRGVGCTPQIGAIETKVDLWHTHTHTHTHTRTSSELHKLFYKNIKTF